MSESSSPPAPTSTRWTAADGPRSHWADVRVVKLLLGAGADPDARDDLGWTPIFHTVNQCCQRRTKFAALREAHADLLVADQYGFTLLHRIAEWGGRWCGVPAIQAGADIEARDNRGRTPLHEAAEDNGEMVRLLLQAGATPEVRDEDGSTPLDLASRDLDDPLLRNDALPIVNALRKAMSLDPISVA